MVILSPELPAIALLRAEGFLGDSPAPCSAKPLRVAFLNLMPKKIDAENDLLRCLARSPFTLDIQLMRIGSHVSKNTPAEHINRFYRTFEEMRGEHFDGFIVNGAPLELMEYTDVSYWRELTEIYNWARASVNACLYVCYGAQSGLYHHFGVPKHLLPEKKFGVFAHQVLRPDLPLMRGMDDEIMMIHSRHTEIRLNDLAKVRSLILAAASDAHGPAIALTPSGHEVFIIGHPEYSAMNLDQEYRRDVAKGLPIHVPENYYRNDDPAQGIVVRWRTQGELLYQNWIRYYLNPAAQ